MAIQQALFMTSPSGGVTYATWNPADKGTGTVLSNGNLTASNDVNNSVRSTIGKSSGKWYWELTRNSGSNVPVVGYANSTFSLTTYPGNAPMPQSGGAALLASPPGFFYYDNGGNNYTGGSWPNTTDVIGFALDMDARSIVLYKNGVSMGTLISGFPAGTYFAAVGCDAGTGSAICNVNFGQNAFAFAVPSGFNAGLYT